MSALEELLERVKAATGPEWEIDAGLLETQGYKVTSAKYGQRLWTRGEDERCFFATEIPSYSASIDAIVALIEQEEPSLVYRICRIADGSGHWQVTEAWCSDYGDEIKLDLIPRPPALAMCTVLLAYKLRVQP